MSLVQLCLNQIPFPDLIKVHHIPGIQPKILENARSLDDSELYLYLCKHSKNSEIYKLLLKIFISRDFSLERLDILIKLDESELIDKYLNFSSEEQFINDYHLTWRYREDTFKNQILVKTLELLYQVPLYLNIYREYEGNIREMHSFLDIAYSTSTLIQITDIRSPERIINSKTESGIFVKLDPEIWTLILYNNLKVYIKENNVLIGDYKYKLEGHIEDSSWDILYNYTENTLWLNIIANKMKI